MPLSNSVWRVICNKSALSLSLSLSLSPQLEHSSQITARDDEIFRLVEEIKTLKVHVFCCVYGDVSIFEVKVCPHLALLSLRMVFYRYQTYTLYHCSYIGHVLLHC